MGGKGKLRYLELGSDSDRFYKKAVIVFKNCKSSGVD